MLYALQFVKGAVAKKDFNPAMNHYRIANRTIRSFNGAVALCAPIPLDLDVTPKADVFYQAIEACCQVGDRHEVPQLSLTEEGTLGVRRGSFRVFIDCMKEDTFPKVFPEGVTVPLTGNLLGALKLLAPFIAEDASRPWARGILFRGPSVYATNNVIVIEHWLGYNFPVEMNLCHAAVKEILRIGEEPAALQMSESSVTFHYSGGRWLRTQTSPTNWPDIGKILDRDSLPMPVPEGLFPSLAELLPFADSVGQVHFLENRVATSAHPSKGAAIDCPGVVSKGVFNVEQLLLLDGIAQVIDFSLYPDPCLFYGNNVRGAIVGIRA